MRSSGGFTLVELSIVIIIIGLITGGVIGARSLIESGKVSSQIQQISEFKTAYSAFKLQYDAIPGDMRDAEDYFGSGCGGSFSSSPVGRIPYFCNGNGDKCISNANCADQLYGNYSDSIRFNVHLNKSEIMPDINYASSSNRHICHGRDGGIFISSPLDERGVVVAGSNSPDVAYLYYSSSAAYEASANVNYCADAQHIDNFITTTKVTKKIDSKIDDGNGGRGAVRALRGVNRNFVVTDCVNADGTYKLNLTGKRCSFRVEIN